MKKEEGNKGGIKRWKSNSLSYRVENERMDGFGASLREKAFLSALLRNDGKIVPAYRDAFPDAAQEVGASTMLKRGKRILGKDGVQKEMRQMLESREVGPEYVLGGIMKVAKGAEKDSDRLKAYELLGKFLKMFGGGESNKTTFNLNINEGTARRLLERRGKYNIGERGDFIDIAGGDDDKGD